MIQTTINAFKDAIINAVKIILSVWIASAIEVLLVIKLVVGENDILLNLR